MDNKLLKKNQLLKIDALALLIGVIISGLILYFPFQLLNTKFGIVLTNKEYCFFFLWIYAFTLTSMVFMN